MYSRLSYFCPVFETNLTGVFVKNAVYLQQREGFQNAVVENEHHSRTK